MREVEILVLKCPSVNSRQLERGDVYSTGGKRYHFNYNVMPAGVAPDIVVVRNNCLHKPTTFPVGRWRTVLALSEPHSVVHFPADYVSQFEVVYSCQPEVKGDNVVYGPAAINWFIGIGLDGRLTPGLAGVVNYSALKASSLPPKSRMMSIIVSGKTFSPGHLRRFIFVERLKKRYAGKIDFFGRGFNYVADKWDALEPYKYTIAIENSVSDIYFTEKISDAILAGCHVLYYGCRRIFDYFPAGAVTPIDMSDFDSACRTIDSIFANDQYADSVEDIKAAKDAVLEKYNYLHAIAMCCERVHLDDSSSASVTLRPISGLGRARNVFNHLVVWPMWDVLGRLCKIWFRL